MRMWNVNPKVMCRRHLLGEHVEMHMFVGTINKGHDISGYVEKNLFEPRLLRIRHDELAAEIVRRGYKHNSPLPECDMGYLPKEVCEGRIDGDSARCELFGRCSECLNYAITDLVESSCA